MTTSDTVPPVELAQSILSELVAFPSVTGLSNRGIVGYVQRYFADLGIETYLDPDSTGEKFNVLACIGPTGSGGIVLSGHLDVVPANPVEWTGDPFRLRKEGHRLIGRGAVDMKGFVAASLAMAPAYKRLAARLSQPILYLLTFDEEIGSVGASQVPAFLRRLGLAPQVSIVGEPTAMRPVVGHKAGIELIATVRGTAGHSSDPRGKINAIDYACRLIAYLGERAREMAQGPSTGSPFQPPYTTISVGRIEGGEARNIIPQHCQFLWEIRPIPEDDGEALLEDIRTYVEHNLNAEMRASAPRTGIEISVEAIYPGLRVTAGSPAARLIERLWTNAPAGVVSFGTDAGHFQRAGIDTIVFGPGDIGNAHRPDEFIELDALRDCLIFLQRLGDDLAKA
jgi:acetylornithine deacetylase